ncbi:putative acetyltransferase [Actinokineospora sp. UTMC 2448]|nr:putative acetyltransferase [Actinokineospora sp. UTMC 2448]
MQGMDVVMHAEVREFAEHALPLLQADPVRNTMALTVLTGALNNDDPDVVMITVQEGGRTVGAAFRTPPWPFIVSGLPPRTHAAVVEHLMREGIECGGFSGPRDAADSLMALWTDATGEVALHSLALRLHRLVEFTPPDVPGAFRWAVEDDIPLLGLWWDEFDVESHVGGGLGDAGEVMVRRSFASGVRRFGMWCDPDGTAVAMAGVSPPLHGMSRIGPVYTAKDQRGRGYGSAVTAAVTQAALDQGAREVLLFTDVTNPVSNAIYRRIGYRPVLEAVEHRLPVANTLDV